MDIINEYLHINQPTPPNEMRYNLVEFKFYK